MSETFAEWQKRENIYFQSYVDGLAFLNRFLSSSQMDSLRKVTDWNIRATSMGVSANRKETPIEQVSALVDDLDENHIELKIKFAGEVTVNADDVNFRDDQNNIIGGEEWACLSVEQRAKYKIENAPRAIAYGSGSWDKVEVSA